MTDKKKLELEKEEINKLNKEKGLTLFLALKTRILSLMDPERFPIKEEHEAIIKEFEGAEMKCTATEENGCYRSYSDKEGVYPIGQEIKKVLALVQRVYKPRKGNGFYDLAALDEEGIEKLIDRMERQSWWNFADSNGKLFCLMHILEGKIREVEQEIREFRERAKRLFNYMQRRNAEVQRAKEAEAKATECLKLIKQCFSPDLVKSMEKIEELAYEYKYITREGAQFNERVLKGDYDPLVLTAGIDEQKLEQLKKEKSQLMQFILSQKEYREDRLEYFSLSLEEELNRIVAYITNFLNNSFGFLADTPTDLLGIFFRRDIYNEIKYRFFDNSFITYNKEQSIITPQSFIDILKRYITEVKGLTVE